MFGGLLLGAGLVATTALLLRRRTRWWLRQRYLRLLQVETDIVSAASIRLVGGVDISFIKGSETDACACLVVVDVRTMEVVYCECRRVVLTAPYIPGFLAFREVKHLLDLLAELKATRPHLLPECILTDGNGIIHPNRFGIACHLGVCANIPTIGVGKALHHVDGLNKETLSTLMPQLRNRGDHAELIGDSGAVWGAILRTSEPAQGTTAFKPVIISVGHGLSLRSAIELVRRVTRHRIPEPVRQADLRSREWLRAHGTVDPHPQPEAVVSTPPPAPAAAASSSSAAAPPPQRPPAAIRSLALLEKLQQQKQDEQYTANVKAYWEGTGNREPYWGVLTHGQYKDQTSLSHANEVTFFASGGKEVEFLERVLKAHAGVESLESLAAEHGGGGLNAMELGCGVGRIAVHMALRCKHIICVDIAESYLQRLRETCASKGVTNYSAITTDTLLSPSFVPPQGGLQLIYSLITLQHNPPSIMLLLIGRVCELLSPGGFALLHAPYFIPDYVFKDYPDVMQMNFIRQSEVLQKVISCRCELVGVVDEGFDYCGGGIQDCVYVVRRPYPGNPVVRSKRK